MQIWYDYYKELGGRIDSAKEFDEVLRQILFTEPIIVSKGRNMKVTYDIAMGRIRDYYDAKFGL